MLEKHRLLGFVRFKLLEGGIYYAPVQPVNNVVELLAPHFAERLQDQNWVIHDTGRSLAAVYDRREWFIADADIDRLPRIEDSEIEYCELWKQFFNSIAISSRTNLKLQKRLMPVRYWRYLPEKW